MESKLTGTEGQGDVLEGVGPLEPCAGAARVVLIAVECPGGVRVGVAPDRAVLVLPRLLAGSHRLGGGLEG